MILLIPLLALLVGVGLAVFLADFSLIMPVKGIYGQYLAVACLAGLDTVFGGIRSGLEGKFHRDVFISGFVANTLIAFFLAWLGDKLFIDLLLAVALVLGSRMFVNLSLIRRFLLTKWQDARERRRQQADLALAQMQADSGS